MRRVIATGALVAAALLAAPAAQGAPKHWGHSHRHKAHPHHRMDASGNAGARVIGGRPAGCPRAYCGCGLARFLKRLGVPGMDDRRLWLAWNWARLYPRAQAHPGAVAVRRHHVMRLDHHIAGSRWLVTDFNGGRGLSWRHVRDVRGYVFVDVGARAALIESRLQ